MVFLVGLGKLIKRIWKKKTYRWLSYAICIITFSTLYDSKVFKKINQGDSVCVNFVKGLYGINIIKDISPKNK